MNEQIITGLEKISESCNVPLSDLIESYSTKETHYIIRKYNKTKEYSLNDNVISERAFNTIKEYAKRKLGYKE